MRKTYCKRMWLNKDESPSTGEIVVFDGMVKDEDSEYRTTFCQIGDCFEKVKLHKADYDSMDDFIEKMKLMRDVIDGFIEHLEENKKEE